jgi:hypothetical protein
MATTNGQVTPIVARRECLIQARQQPNAECGMWNAECGIEFLFIPNSEFHIPLETRDRHHRRGDWPAIPVRPLSPNATNGYRNWIS